MQKLTYIDNSGSTNHNFYWDHVKKIVEDLNDEKVIFWNYKVLSDQDKKDLIKSRNLPAQGGTELLPVLEDLHTKLKGTQKTPDFKEAHLTPPGPIFDEVTKTSIEEAITEVLIITDGEISNSEIESCQNFLNTMDSALKIEVIVINREECSRWSSIPLVFSVYSNLKLSYITKEKQVAFDTTSACDWISQLTLNFNQFTISKFQIFLNSKTKQWTIDDFAAYRTSLINKLKAAQEISTFDLDECTPDSLEVWRNLEFKTSWQKVMAVIQSSIDKVMTGSKISDLNILNEVDIPRPRVSKENNTDENEPDFGVQDRVTLEILPKESDVFVYFFDPGDLDQHDSLEQRQQLMILINPFLKSKTICTFEAIATNYDACTRLDLKDQGVFSTNSSLALLIRSDKNYDSLTDQEKLFDLEYNNKVLARLVAARYDPTEVMISLCLWFLKNDHKQEALLLLTDIKRRLRQKVHIPEKGVTVSRKFYIYSKYGITIGPTSSVFAKSCLDQLQLLFDFIDSPETAELKYVIKNVGLKLIQTIDSKLDKTKLLNFYLASKNWPIQIGSDKFNNPIFGYLMNVPFDDEDKPGPRCLPNDKETEQSLRMVLNDPRFESIFDRTKFESLLFNQDFKQRWQNNRIEFNIHNGTSLISINLDLRPLLSTLEESALKIDLPEWHQQTWKQAREQYTKRAHEHYHCNKVVAESKTNLFDSDAAYQYFKEKPFIPMYALMRSLFPGRIFDEATQKFKRAENRLVSMEILDKNKHSEMFNVFISEICKHGGRILTSEMKHVPAKMNEKNAHHFIPATFLFWAVHVFFEICLKETI